jgi:hypothetical protein
MIANSVLSDLIPFPVFEGCSITELTPTSQFNVTDGPSSRYPVCGVSFYILAQLFKNNFSHVEIETAQEWLEAFAVYQTHVKLSAMALSAKARG